MTINEVFETLHELPCRWINFIEGYIYSETYGSIFTELAKAHGREFKMTEWQEAAEFLKISPQLAEALRQAADNEPGHDPELRKRLLQATNLEERAA